MTPKVSIVILNWNGYEDTRGCLVSLQKIDYPNYEIIVIDNGSTDGSPEMIESDFPEIKLIRNKENLGFERANNVGIREALKEDAAYVSLLNNDTIVAPNFLSELVKAFEGDVSVGMAGPKIYYMDKPYRISFAGGKISWIFGKSWHEGDGRLDNEKYNKQKYTDYITGACMVIKTEVFKKIGLFNETYFRYWEDTELCERAIRAGYKLLYVPSSTIKHKVAATTGGASFSTEYYDARNSMYFFFSYGPSLTYKLSAFSFIIARASFRSFKLAIKYIVGDKKALHRIMGIWRGIRDFFMGKTGELK